MRALDKNLTIVSAAERAALYGLPDFDDFQRAEYFDLTTEEHTLLQSRVGLAEQVLCILQIGYFKAKRAFFKFRLADVPPEDIDFLMRRYFPGQTLRRKPVRQAEYYRQRKEILRLFGYRLWSQDFTPLLSERAAQQVRRDVTPAFVLTELIALLRQEKIVRPGYHSLQAVISEALAAERRRLSEIVEKALDHDAQAALQQLLVREETLSELAQVKQDAKNFGYRMMALEREKRLVLAPLYRVAKDALPKLDISQQNVGYYASLATYYSIYDLRRLKPEQTHLYLLCYSWQRYRQLSDNLADAFDFHMKQVEDATKEAAEQHFTKALAAGHREAPRVGQVLLLYVDEALNDATPFGSVRSQAFTILPKETLLTVGRRMCGKSVSQIDLRWQAVDKLAARFKKHLRPLVMELDFSSLATFSPWLAALRWMKSVFARQQPLAQRPVREIPENELARVIAEVEPARPSDVVAISEPASDRDRTQITPDIVSSVREGDPNRLRKRLVGDLDSILLLALRKEPERRYGSVESFAEDLQRHLEQRPVHAREASPWERFQHFRRRNPGGFLAAGLVAILFLAGLAAVALQARHDVLAARLDRGVVVPYLVPLWLFSSGIAAAALSSIVYFGRPNRVQRLGAAVGGLAFGLGLIGRMWLERSLGLWWSRVEGNDDPLMLLSPLTWFVFFVGSAALLVVLLMIGRRFGWKGQILSLAVLGLYQAVRERIWIGEFIPALNFQPGWIPILASAGMIFAAGLTGLLTMRLIGGADGTTRHPK